MRITATNGPMHVPAHGIVVTGDGIDVDDTLGAELVTLDGIIAAHPGPVDASEPDPEPEPDDSED